MTCPTCGADDVRGHVPSPADAVAASICWLTSNLLASGPAIERLRERRRHSEKGCAYCGMTQAAKLELVARGRAHERDDPRWKAWEGLTRSQQFARVCDAQEVSWVDALPS